MYSNETYDFIHNLLKKYWPMGDEEQYQKILSRIPEDGEKSLLLQKLEAVYKIANNSLYFSDNRDYKSDLWEVCKKIHPEREEEIGEEYVE